MRKAKELSAARAHAKNVGIEAKYFNNYAKFATAEELNEIQTMGYNDIIKMIKRGM